MNFKYLDAEGTVVCSLALSHLWAEVYGIDQRGSGNCSADDWSKLINHATNAALEKGAKSVVFRVVETPELQELLQRLPGLGFTFKEGRVEYRAFLADLPIDQGSPFRWETAKRLEWSDEQIGHFLREVNRGAPDSEPGEDPLTYIQDWLKDPVLLSGADCISIGFMNDRPCALVIAQVISKVTDVGLTTACRNGYGNRRRRIWNETRST